MMVNAYGNHVGGGGRPWQLDVIDRLVDKGAMRYCDVCGRPMPVDGYARKYCSFACRQEANRYMARMAKRKERAILKAHRERGLG